MKYIGRKPPRTPVRGFRGLPDGLVVLCCLVAVAVLAGLSFGARIWWLDLLNHGVVITGWLCLLGAILATVGRRSVPAMFLFLVTVLQLVRWVPWPVRNPNGGTPVVLMLANVLSSNPDHDALLALVTAESPDVVGLLEVNEDWLADLGPLRASHPHHLEHPRKDNFGIALYSRIPLEDLRVEWIGARLVPSLCATLPGGTQLTLTHPVPPVSVQYARYRNTQLVELETRMAGDRWIVFGDLNTTPWSSWFPDAPIRGSLPWATFPDWYGIPIDHVLAGSDIGFDERRIGARIGSDHRPVIARLRLPDPN